MPIVICKFLQQDQQPYTTNPDFNPYRPAGSEWQNLNNIIERDNRYSNYFTIRDTLLGTTQGTINARTFVTNYFIAKKNIFNLPSWVSSDESAGNLRMKLYVKLYQNDIDETLKVGFKSVQAIYKQGASIVYGNERTYQDLPYNESLNNYWINNDNVWEFDGNCKLWTDGFTDLDVSNINDDEFGFKIQLVFTWGLQSALQQPSDEIEEPENWNTEFGIEWIQVEFEWNNSVIPYEAYFTQVSSIVRPETEKTIYLSGNQAFPRRAIKAQNWEWSNTSNMSNFPDNNLVTWKPNNNQLNYAQTVTDPITNIVYPGYDNPQSSSTIPKGHLQFINDPNRSNNYDTSGIGRSFFFTDYLRIYNLSPKLPSNLNILGIEFETSKNPGVQKTTDTRINYVSKNGAISYDTTVYAGYHVWDETVQLHNGSNFLGENNAFVEDGIYYKNKEFSRTIDALWPVVFPDNPQNSLRGFSLSNYQQTQNNIRKFGSPFYNWGLNSLNSSVVNDNNFGIVLSAIYVDNWLNKLQMSSNGINAVIYPVFTDPALISFSGSNWKMGYDNNKVTLYVNDQNKPLADFISWGTYFSSDEILGFPELRRLKSNLRFTGISSLEVLGSLTFKYNQSRNIQSLRSIEFVSPNHLMDITQRVFVEGSQSSEIFSYDITNKFRDYVKDFNITSSENISSNIEFQKSTSISPYSIKTQELVPKQDSVYPFPQDINLNSIKSTEKIDKYELLRYFYDPIFISKILNPSYEVGYYDLLALSQSENTEPQYDISFNSIDEDFLFTANNINLNYQQSAVLNKRLAGEGASPNTFQIGNRTLSFDFNIPIRAESWGYTDTTFSAIYDYFIQGYKGNKTTYVARISNNMPDVFSGVSEIEIDNIVDFMNLGSNFTAYIRSDDGSETNETISVASVNKAQRKLILSSATVNSHTSNKTYIWAKPTNPNENREASFTLYSLREGLLSGCMVDSITINITPGQTINARISLKFTDLDRTYQKNLLNNFDSINANINNRRPNYLINGSQVTINGTRTQLETFGLGDSISSDYFRGFQEAVIRDYQINEITLEFKNDLQPIYSLNSKSNNRYKNLTKNLEPYAYYSNGRSISGTIKYSSPIKPELLAEILTGPGDLNDGGLVINFGTFKLTLPELVWSPDSSTSDMEQVHQKSVSFSVATQKLSFDPYFESTGAM